MLPAHDPEYFPGDERSKHTNTDPAWEHVAPQDGLAHVKFPCIADPDRGAKPMLRAARTLDWRSIGEAATKVAGDKGGAARARRPVVARHATNVTIHANLSCMKLHTLQICMSSSSFSRGGNRGFWRLTSEKTVWGDKMVNFYDFFIFWT